MGLHSHIGSQIFDVDGFELAAHRVIGFLRDVVAEFGAEKTAQIGIVDLGGGLGISYLPMMIRHRSRTWLPSSIRSCARNLPLWDCRHPHWWSSRAGRSPVPGTITLYEVGTVKDVELGGGRTRRYISVDRG